VEAEAMAAMTQVRDRPSPEARIKAALWFADRGFGIFSVWSTTDAGVCRCPAGSACTAPGKHPVTPHGFQDATTDPQRIRTLLSAGSQPNYGMVCPDGVFALDVDAEDDGIARLVRLESLYGPLPPTLRTQTAHGQHVFLRWPVDLPRPLKKMFGYVTRWGSGRQAGYVIGPRSVHASGAEYQPAAGPLDVAEMPETWARAALAGESPEPVVRGPRELPQKGGRHDWLRDKARTFRGVMDDPGTLRAALLAENAKLDEPKTPEEVDRAIGDVFVKFELDPPDVAENRAAARAGDELDLLGMPTSGDFPEHPDPVAFDGLLGGMVGDLSSGTDASEVGLLGSLIAFTGALVPGQAYFHRLQTSSPYIALVGESSIGRKGTAMTRVMDAMGEALQIVTVNRAVLDGMNSGEGLVSSLYYKKEHFPYEPCVGLVFEEEYASLLASRGRDGSTLDPKMRQAFDGGPLSNRKAGESKTVVPPYWLPALIGITPVELRARLEPGALQSGSANRWLYLPVIRRDVIPLNTAPAFSKDNRDRLLKARAAAAEKPATLNVDPAVTHTLAEYADFLPSVSVGVARDLTRRLAIIGFRVALVHALIERAGSVTSSHLARALALTEYARRGIAWVFGDTIGNPDANLLLRHLHATGGLTRTAISREIIRDPIRRQAAIDELLRLGKARIVTLQTAGRGRLELQPVENEGAFRTYFHGSANRTTEKAENVEVMERSGPTSTNGIGKNVEISREEVGNKGTEGPPMRNVGRRDDGEIWCGFMTEHFARHRDVSSSVPWCEICSPVAG
jgi:hypothetical protein